MTKTLKKTNSFELFEAEGMGSYAIQRLSDEETTAWYTGSEGSGWARHLSNLSDKKFDKACEIEFENN